MHQSGGKLLSQLRRAEVELRFENDVYAALFDGLVEMTPGDTWAYEPSDMIVAIEQVDPTHITFQLRAGLPWTNGFGEVSAEDVKYSFERIADPANGSCYAGDWISLDHVEVRDALSGMIVLKNPDTALWTTVLTWGSGNWRSDLDRSARRF